MLGRSVLHLEGWVETAEGLDQERVGEKLIK